MKLGIAVMAHRARTASAWALARSVRANRVIWDQGKGELDTGYRAWKSLTALETDWSIVLQDDAIPVPDFRDHAARALDSLDQPTAVSFYVGTCRPRASGVIAAVRAAEATDASWLVADRMLWGPGIAVPTSHLFALLGWYWNSPRAYDQRIGQFYERAGVPIRYTWPSLVDHADSESLVRQARPHRGPECPRVAHKVGVRDAYDGPSVRIPAR